MKELPEEQKAHMDGEHRELMVNQFKLNFQAGLFKSNEEFKNRLNQVKNYKLLKFSRFMQSLFYLLEYKKDNIVEEGTQKFNWKSAKKEINGAFIEKMLGYKVIGPKPQQFAAYQTINFIERNIGDIDPQKVDEYNLALGKLFRWLKLAIDSRKADIIRRKAHFARNREERDFKIKAKEDRAAKRNLDLADARAKFLDDNKEAIDAFNAYQAK